MSEKFETVEDVVREMRNSCARFKDVIVARAFIETWANEVESLWRCEKAGLERKVADALTTGAFVAEASARKPKSEVAKERDDLKKSKTNNMFDARLGNECATVKRLEASERCIEDVENDLKQSLFLDDEHSTAAKSALSIIRAYREQKEVSK